MELVDVVDSKSTAGDSVPVRVRSPAPRRSKLYIACSDFFKVRARSCRCSSFPNHNRLHWVVVGFWVQTWRPFHLYRCNVPKRKTRFMRVFLFLFRRPGAASPLGVQMLGQSEFALRRPAAQGPICSWYLSCLNAARGRKVRFAATFFLPYAFSTGTDILSSSRSKNSFKIGLWSSGRHTAP